MSRVFTSVIALWSFILIACVLVIFSPGHKPHEGKRHVASFHHSISSSEPSPQHIADFQMLWNSFSSFLWCFLIIDLTRKLQYKCFLTFCFNRIAFAVWGSGTLAMSLRTHIRTFLFLRNQQCSFSRMVMIHTRHGKRWPLAFLTPM